MSRDNSDLPAKLAIRRWLIDRLGGISRLSVLELYAGTGQIHDRLYVGCRRHLAFDKRRIERPGWLWGDNRMLLRRHIGDGWDLYDADAYSNPWQICELVCRLHRKPERFGIAATCGIARGLKNGKSNRYVRQAIGYNLSDTRLLIRWYDDVIRWIVEKWRDYECEIEDARHVRSRLNGDVHYWAFLVRKKKR